MQLEPLPTTSVKTHSYFADPDIHSLRLPCATHIASTVQGYAYGSVAGDISDVIALVGTMKRAGALEIFRVELKDVLKFSANVVNAAPPHVTHPEVVLRDACFAKRIGDSSYCCARRLALLKILMWETFSRVWLPSASRPTVLSMLIDGLREYLIYCCHMNCDCSPDSGG